MLEFFNIQLISNIDYKVTPNSTQLESLIYKWEHINQLRTELYLQHQGRPLIFSI
jgi:hypothetical protein